MKISIIMAAKNSMPYIKSSIKSFQRQNYKKKELIIVYANSSDLTEKYLKTVKNKDIKIFKLDAGIYRSLNYGIKKSKGNVIGTLHSDDCFFDEKVLSNIINVFKNKNVDLCYGNIAFSKKKDLTIIKRIWIEKKDNFKNKYWTPPHTATFITKKIFKKLNYNKKYIISSDTDFLIRVLKLKNIKLYYLPRFISIMRLGGLSTNLLFIFKKIFEDYKIFKKNKLKLTDLLLKKSSKIKQFKIINNHIKNSFIKKINQYS